MNIILVLKQYIWAFWDVAAIFIFFICIISCVNRGFVSTAVRLCMYIGATIAAVKFNKQLADFLYNNVVYDAVKNTVTKNIDAFLSKTDGAALDILNAIPSNLRLLIGDKREQVAGLQFDAAEALSAEIMELALKTPITRILESVSFLFLFAIAAWLISWLSRFFTGINRIPVIGGVNAFAGGLAGVVEGIITLYFGGVLAKLAVALSGEGWWWLNSGVMESTYIWRRFY